MAFEISPQINASTIIATCACLIIGSLILLSASRLSQQNTQTKDKRVSDNISRGENFLANYVQADAADHSTRPIIGPKAPQEFTFFVNTPPAEHVPLHVGSKHKSIKRQIVINPYNMTWESRRPKKRKGPSVSVSEGDDGKKALEFLKDEKGIMPISALLSVSAQMPEKSATVELTIDTSVQGETTNVAEGLLSNVVTMDNWKTHDISYGNKKKKRNAGADASFENDYEEDDGSFYDASTILGIGSETDGNHYCSSSITTASTSTEKTNSKNLSTRKKSMNTVIMKEYTFTGEYETGAFQTLHLALNSVGYEIRDMYSALEMVHKRSEAHGGDLYGICDQCAKGIAGDEVGKVIYSCPCAGVALDDVQRCLGGFPSIGKRISRIYDHYHGRSQALTSSRKQKTTESLIVSAADGIEAENGEVNSKESSRRKRAAIYEEKRIVLGYIDFFRLFIPMVFHGTPYGSPVAAKGSNLGMMDGLDVHQARVQQLLRLQQRVASAAVNVRTYTNAMQIAHEGWKLEFPSTIDTNPRNQLTKRLAFDYDSLNADFDSCSENEYYCPTMSRQNKTLASSSVEAGGSSTQSHLCLQQAYALVACKLIDLPQRNEGQNDKEKCPLMKSSDPVASIPSLHSIIEKNQGSEFFVVSLFYERKNAMMVLLYVKCIPEGLDEAFDESMETFANGSNEIRDDILNLSSQVGSPKPPSYLNFWRNWSRGSSASSQQQTNSRILLPSIKLSQATQTKHFGGSQPTETFLDNYLAVNCEIRARSFTSYRLSYGERILRDLIPSIGASPNPNTIDLVFELDGVHRSISSVRFALLDRAGGIPWKNVMGKIDKAPVSLNEESQTITDITEEVPVLLDEEPDTKDRVSVIEDEYRGDIDALKDILSCITVPVRDVNANPDDAMSTNTSIASMKILDRQVLSFFDDFDIKRHLIATKKNLKEAAIGMTRCAAWRGITFPIDTRMCQIELLSGQFFQQGVDLHGSPVFYFRNMCRGLWRKDINASTLAVLHRLERAFTIAAKSKNDFQCTLVILMGKPRIIDEAMGDSTEVSSAKIDQDEKCEDPPSLESAIDENLAKSCQAPSYHVHTNFKFVQHLINITSQNYPERLGKVLVVPNGGWEKFIGVHGLRRYIQSPRTRSKVQILDDLNELKIYISPDQLINLAGGESPISPEAFGVN